MKSRHSCFIVILALVSVLTSLSTATPCENVKTRDDQFADFLTWHYGTNEESEAYYCQILGREEDIFFRKARQVFKNDNIRFIRVPESLQCYVGSYVLIRPLEEKTEFTSKLNYYKSNLEFFKVSYNNDGFMDLVNLINGMCHTFRTVKGELNELGRRRQLLLSNFYINEKSEKCEEIHWNGSLNRNIFYRDYLLKSKPVVFKNFAKKWPAMKRWTDLNFFSEGFLAEKSVMVQTSPCTNYEGVEPRSWWTNESSTLYEDRSVVFKDLVLVRPASKTMTMKQLAGVIKSIAKGELLNASAYLEYSEVDEISSHLKDDVIYPDFMKDFTIDAKNMWLSDGNTVGKLHFDPHENILVQLVGTKVVTLFHPHNNSNIYEGKLRQAGFEAEVILDTDGKSEKPWQFSRKGLKADTELAHVFSPIELANVDYKRFPRFKEAKSITCTIENGDALFMPSYWWHEVNSKPDREKKFNLAFNFWYTPIILKKSGFINSKLDLNPVYYKMIETFTDFY